VSTTRRSPGRRPGGPDTRGEILVAARVTFADKGFEGTSLRGVARAAGVDAALVHHYFDSKESLFIEAMEFPVDPRMVAARIWDGPVEQVGERLVRMFLTVWDAPESRASMQALLRSAVGNENIARLIRDAMGRLVFGPVLALLDTPDADLRISLVASQLVGLAMARYVLELEPLSTEPIEDVVARVAPNIQRYLTG
jgi:AcrR family transcriptional regulator